MKIVYFANNWLGCEVLRWMREQGQALEALVVHPPSNQKFRSKIISLSGCPEDRIFDGSTLRQPAVRERLTALDADLALSVLFGYLIRPKLLRSFRLGVVNLHPAYLPFNRGSYPNVWSIIDRSPAGVTLHYMDQNLDTGDIIAQQLTKVLSWDTGESLYRRLEQDALALFKAHFQSIVDERAPRTPQNKSEGTSHQVQDVDMLDRIDLDAQVRAGDLIDRLRARTFTGYRGAYFEDGGRRVWVRVELQPEEDQASIDNKPGVSVGRLNDMKRLFKLSDGPRPAYVVAELSANHNGSLERAKEHVRAAAQAGADAIKLQTYTADTMTIDCDREEFKIKGGLWDGRTLYDLYNEAHTPWEWHAPLRDLAHELGLDFFSTPFDRTAVEFLETLDVPAYKIASFELVDIPLIELVAATRKPIILSTGMGTLDEISEAVATIRGVWGDKDHGLCLLKCTSAYPARPEDMNLATIPAMVKQFGVTVGLSDHTLGSTVAVAAVALGARVVEKHFILRRSDGGPDSAFSMEPEGFAQMVRDIRTVEAATGRPSFGPAPCERGSLVFRRSLYAVNDIEKGQPFTNENVGCIRPGMGLSPRFFGRVLRAWASQDIVRGTPLTWDIVDELK